MWRYATTASLFRLLVATALLTGGLVYCSPGYAQGGGPPQNSPPPPRDNSEQRARSAGPTFQIGPKININKVIIRGNQTVPSSKVMSFLRTRKGRSFDPEVVQSDVHRLSSSGLFHDVQTFKQTVPGGVVITFEVFERPTIHQIKFLGATGIKEKTLLKKSGLEVGESLNIYSVEEARRKVEEHYREKGYNDARVTIAKGNQPADRDVVLMVNPGNKHQLWDVTIDGNTIASDARLKTQIDTKMGLGNYKMIFGGLDRAKVDADVEKLTAYYRALGYFRARVGREITYGASGKWATVNFVIDEGPRYKIRSVSFAGEDDIAIGDLERQITLASGAFYHQGDMNRDLRALRDLYGSQGYIFADIKADPRFLEEPGYLDLVYNISEGEQYRVGRIIVDIAGEHPHTRRSVVLSRLSFRPGDIIDSREIQNSERRLKSSQLFKHAPQEGITPRIVVRPPEDTGTRTASSTIRGQSPDDGSTTPRRWTDRVRSFFGAKSPPAKPPGKTMDVHVNLYQTEAAK
jgi:outer membrane protein insertion porin family